MFRNRIFLLQVSLLFALTFGGALWIFNGAPIPAIVPKQLEPRPEIPAFEESIAKRLGHDSRGNEVSIEGLRRSRLHSSAIAILLASRNYEKGECSAESRRYLIGRINSFEKYRRQYPTVELPNRYEHLIKGEVTDQVIEDAINVLFVGSLLTLEEFPAETRMWLKTFVRPGSEEKAQDIGRCQTKD